MKVSGLNIHTMVNSTSQSIKKIIFSEKILFQDQMHKLCFNMAIADGKLKAFAFFNDAQNPIESVKSTHYGEFDLSISSLKLCVLSGYKGDIDEQYICLYTDQLQLSHNNHAFTDDVLDGFKPCNDDQFSQLFFSQTKYNVVLQQNDMAKCVFDEKQLQLPMISLAIHSKLNEPTRLSNLQKIRTKDILIAININNICLNHVFCNEKFHWLIQLIDLVNLEDIEITGYILPIVITELHLNVSNSSVDYRPLNLPTKSLVAFKSLRISSNVTQNSQMTMLVFNIEDLFLFLTNRQFSRTELDMTYDLRRDYVCIANTDVFEFRLLITEKGPASPAHTKQGKKLPDLDIKIRCNLIQLRTCVDSCYSLIELLSYICMDGDLCDGKVGDDSSSIATGADPVIASSPCKETPLLAQHVQIDSEAHIKNIIDDAMMSDGENSIDYQYDSPFANKNQSEDSDGDDEDTEQDDSFSEYIKDDDLLADFDIVDLIPGTLVVVRRFFSNDC
jgi:hypothetical protein